MLWESIRWRPILVISQRSFLELAASHGEKIMTFNWGDSWLSSQFLRSTDWFLRIDGFYFNTLSLCGSIFCFLFVILISHVLYLHVFSLSGSVVRGLMQYSCGLCITLCGCLIRKPRETRLDCEYYFSNLLLFFNGPSWYNILLDLEVILFTQTFCSWWWSIVF